MMPPRPPALTALSSDDLAALRAIKAGHGPAQPFAGRVGFASGTVVHLANACEVRPLCDAERVGILPHHQLAQIALGPYDRTLTLCRRCAQHVGDPALVARFAAQRQIFAATHLAVPTDQAQARSTAATLRALGRRADLAEAVASAATSEDIAGWARLAQWAHHMLDYIGDCCAELLATVDASGRPALVAGAATSVVAYAAAKSPYIDQLDLTALTCGTSTASPWTLLPGFLLDWTASVTGGRCGDPISSALDGGLTDVTQLANVALLEPFDGERTGSVAARSWRAHVESELRSYRTTLDGALADVQALDSSPTVVLHVTRPAELATSQWAELLRAYPTHVGVRGRTEWALPAVVAAQIIQHASLSHRIVRYLHTDEYTTVTLKLWQPGSPAADGLLCYAAQMARVVT